MWCLVVSVEFQDLGQSLWTFEPDNVCVYIYVQPLFLFHFLYFHFLFFIVIHWL